MIVINVIWLIGMTSNVFVLLRVWVFAIWLNLMKLCQANGRGGIRMTRIAFCGGSLMLNGVSIR